MKNSIFLILNLLITIMLSSIFPDLNELLFGKEITDLIFILIFVFFQGKSFNEYRLKKDKSRYITLIILGVIAGLSINHIWNRNFTLLDAWVGLVVIIATFLVGYYKLFQRIAKCFCNK
ncbi:MAG: hypothetical protein EOM28_06115 [Clostridia bacterium]|nr:hypothetical protein [Clostridia bacterium]